MDLNCTCDECGQAQMRRYVEEMAWGVRITWRCVETGTPHAWKEVNRDKGDVE